MRAMAGDGHRGGLDRAVMARLYTYLYGAGSLLVFLTLALPHDPQRQALPIALVALVAAVAAAIFLISFDRLPMLAFRVAPSVGSVLIGVLAYSAGPTGAVAYLFFLLWVSLAASYFFTLDEALAHAAFAVGIVVIVLLLRDAIPQPELLVVMIAGTLLLNGVMMVGLRFQLQRLMSDLERAARTDFLTRLANRREFNERFSYEVARALRAKHPLSLLVFDLDNFKRINDSYGHDGGDQALERFAAILRGSTRKIDTAARIGGEEFALVAPDSAAPEGAVLADRVRAEVEAAFAAEHGLTVSCGVAALPAVGNSEEDLLKAADRALYRAKDEGKNCVVMHEPEADEGPRRRDAAGGDLAIGPA